MQWNEWKLNEWKLIVFGLIIGITLGVVYDDAIHYKLLLSDAGRLQWEILLSGAAALAGAGWTVSKIREQIRQTERIATDQRRRRARAARALLPLALSEVANYATACVNRLYTLKPCFQHNGSLDRSQVANYLTNWQMPGLPENVLPLFKECIEFIDDIPANTIAELIRYLQIQTFRIREDIVSQT